MSMTISSNKKKFKEGENSNTPFKNEMLKVNQLIS